MTHEVNNGSRNTEFFLIRSYSCLPTAVARLEEIERQGKEAVIFCLSRPSYRFLSPLADKHAWIKVVSIDVEGLGRRSLRNPLHLWRTRREVRQLFDQWFSGIPSRSIVHFYNRLVELFFCYWIWRLRDKCSIYYAECDPMTLFVPARGFFTCVRRLALYCIYPMPFQMVRIAGSRSRPVPALNDRFMQQGVHIEYARVTNIAEIRHTKLYRDLALHRDSQVLWVLGMEWETGLVVSEQYTRVLRECARIVSAVYPAARQSVKFHPRATTHEAVWDPVVSILPDHVPAEFLNLPDLEVVLTISSTATSWNRATNIRVISLVDILPFVSSTVRDTQRQTIRHFAAGIGCCYPASLDDLRLCLQGKPPA
jgi:hypothetical protein